MTIKIANLIILILFFSSCSAVKNVDVPIYPGAKNVRSYKAEYGVGVNYKVESKYLLKIVDFYENELNKCGYKKHIFKNRLGDSRWDEFIEGKNKILQSISIWVDNRKEFMIILTIRAIENKSFININCQKSKYEDIDQIK